MSFWVSNDEGRGGILRGKITGADVKILIAGVSGNSFRFYLLANIHNIQDASGGPVLIGMLSYKDVAHYSVWRGGGNFAWLHPHIFSYLLAK